MRPLEFSEQVGKAFLHIKPDWANHLFYLSQTSFSESYQETIVHM